MSINKKVAIPVSLAAVLAVAVTQFSDKEEAVNEAEKPVTLNKTEFTVPEYDDVSEIDFSSYSKEQQTQVLRHLRDNDALDELTDQQLSQLHAELFHYNPIEEFESTSNDNDEPSI